MLMYMPKLESCNDLTVLLNRMHSDLQVYCEAVAELGHMGGTGVSMSPTNGASRARIAFEAARDRLNGAYRPTRLPSLISARSGHARQTDDPIRHGTIA